jgi:hypothetical protein
MFLRTITQAENAAWIRGGFADSRVHLIDYFDKDSPCRGYYSG